MNSRIKTQQLEAIAWATKVLNVKNLTEVELSAIYEATCFYLDGLGRERALIEACREALPDVIVAARFSVDGEPHVWRGNATAFLRTYNESKLARAEWSSLEIHPVGKTTVTWIHTHSEPGHGVPKYFGYWKIEDDLGALSDVYVPKSISWEQNGQPYSYMLDRIVLVVRQLTQRDFEIHVRGRKYRCESGCYSVSELEAEAPTQSE
jgi:hypothetical protein